MRKLSTLWNQSGLVFALLVALSGCSGFPTDVTSLFPQNAARFSCSIFREALWQEFRFGEDSSDEVIDTATSLWKSVYESQIESSELYGDYFIWGLEWWDHSDGVRARYFAEGGKGRKLVSVRVDLDPAPTLAQIFDCLGPPQYYWAEVPPNFVNVLGLGLWYVEKGVRFGGLTYGGKVQLTEFHPDFRMDTFHVVPPGDLEKMISHLSPQSLHSNILCTLRPWPGSIEAIEVESLLDENPGCEQ